jgi:hypothetical protein
MGTERSAAPPEFIPVNPSNLPESGPKRCRHEDFRTSLGDFRRVGRGLSLCLGSYTSVRAAAVPPAKPKAFDSSRWVAAEHFSRKQNARTRELIVLRSFVPRRVVAHTSGGLPSPASPVKSDARLSPLVRDLGPPIVSHWRNGRRGDVATFHDGLGHGSGNCSSA